MLAVTAKKLTSTSPSTKTPEMARLYTNENFPQQAVAKLAQLGHDVETSHDAGNSGRAVPDEEVLDYATRQQRILITLNRRHFVLLHGKRADHGGIIVCTFDADFCSLALRIHGVLCAIQDARGQLFRINRPGV
jgi:predicted nuclease of predicted toxin-antitoxin system